MASQSACRLAAAAGGIKPLARRRITTVALARCNRAASAERAVGGAWCPREENRASAPRHADTAEPAIPSPGRWHIGCSIRRDAFIRGLPHRTFHLEELP